MGTSIDAIRAALEAKYDAEAAAEGNATKTAGQWARSRRRSSLPGKEVKAENARAFLAQL